MSEATTKSASQRDKILTWLQMRGAQGILNTELNSLCMRFGARIWELRKAGYNIKTVRVSDTEFRFMLETKNEIQAVVSRVEHDGGVHQPTAGAKALGEPLAHEYRKQASLFA